MGLADTLERGIATAKRTVSQFLKPVEWLQRTGDKDVRGRQTVRSTLLNVLIETNRGLQRGAEDTERSDEITLLLLEPLAVKDSDTFRWGTPAHVYKVKRISGVVKDQATGERFATEVVVVR